jgi:hypothetical protein
LIRTPCLSRRTSPVIYCRRVGWPFFHV